MTLTTGAKTRFLLLAGAAAALCWSIADMLLVGFVQEPDRYPLISQDLALQLGDDVNLAALMQDASPERLFWGVILATFSVAGYLAASFGVHRLLPRGRTATAAFVLLFLGYALSPLGHAGYYYVGRLSQTLVTSKPADHSLLIALLKDFHTMLSVHWYASVAASALAWLLIGGLLLRNRELPRGLVAVNPVLLGLAIAGISALFPTSVLAACIGAATLNLAQLAFFTAALLCTRRRPGSDR